MWQNTYNHFDPTAAFGGYKESGFGREGGPAGLASVPEGASDDARLEVRKTYKLWIGGAFVRSESGRYDEAGGFNYPARLAQGRPRRGRRRAQGGRTVGGADRVQPRPDPVPRGRGARVGRATDSSRRQEVDAAVDVLLHYAGWTDKLHAVLGGINPVAAPFLSFTLPEPTGVVGVIAPDAPPLLGLVAEIAPALAAGNVGRRDPVRDRTRCPASTSPRCSASPMSRRAS